MTIHRTVPTIRLLASLSLLLLTAQPARAVRLGPVDFLPTLQIEGVYDDNIFLRSEDDPLPIEEDYLTRIIPAVAFTHDRGPTDFLVRYQNEFLFYMNFPDRDATGGNHGFDLSIAHAFGERSSVELDNTFRIGTDISSIAEQGGADLPPTGILPRGREYRTNDLTIAGGYAVSRRLDLTGEIAYEYRWYGTGLEGEPGDELQTEDHLESIFVTAIYALTTTHALTGSIGFSHNDYDDQGKARYLTATIGYVGQLISSLSLEGSAGLQYLNEDRLPDAPTTHEESVWPYAGLAATYALSDLRFRTEASVGLSDTSGYGGTAIRRQVRLALDYLPLPDMTLSTFGLYTKSDSTSDEPGESQDLESFQAGIGLSYRITPWVSTRLDYTYIDQDSSGALGGTYKDNRVVIGFTFSLPETLI
jgi:opacity protein-like surface antigen